VGGALSLASWSVQALEIAKERLDVLGRDLAQGPAELGSVIANTKAALMTGMGVASFTYVVILLMVASASNGCTGATLMLRCAPRRRCLRLAVRCAASRLRRFLLRLGGLLLFALAANRYFGGVFLARGVQELVIAATLFVVVLRLAWIVIALVLAPDSPGCGCPGHERPRRLDRRGGDGGGLSPRPRALRPELMERLAGADRAAGALRFAMVTLACLLLLATAFAFFGRRSRAPRFPGLSSSRCSWSRPTPPGC